MLEKPDIDDIELTEHLNRSYGLSIIELEFLPLGADASAAVYRALIGDGSAYFVKLRRGNVDRVSVSLLRFLSDQGIKHILPPQVTHHRELWTHLRTYTVTLFPFINGKNGYEAPLTVQSWRKFGKMLKSLHTLALPAMFIERLRHETYDASTRETVKAILTGLETTAAHDLIATRTAQFIHERKAQIHELIEDAERFAQTLRVQPLKLVLCHDDLHAGNLLIENERSFYIVDWDYPILAPKERDLMFIGGGLGFRGYTPEEEEDNFYQGYAQADINPVGVAYYRLERILRDIEAFWGEIMTSSGSNEDREASLGYLKANFEPGGTVERAYAVDVAA